MHLQLDKDFNPFRGTTSPAFDAFKFNGGEVHVRLSDDITPKFGRVDISARITNGDKLLQVLMLVDALERRGFYARNDISLLMPYLPYARQDRVCVTGEAFSLKVFTSLINNLNLRKVTIFDAHSDVGPALLDRCENLSNYQYVLQAIKEIASNDLVLVSPDAGASKKTEKLAEYIGGISVVNCSKVRDVITGNLKGFEVFADDLTGKDCLIVDDICDGGRTFAGIGKELKAKNAKSVSLFVTHGIFSAGLPIQNIGRVFCTDSFKTVQFDTANFKQFPITIQEIF